MAFDKSEPKVAKLKTNCDKLGIQSVTSFVYDGIKALDPEKQYNRENGKYILHLMAIMLTNLAHIKILSFCTPNYLS